MSCVSDKMLTTSFPDVLQAVALLTFLCPVHKIVYSLLQIYYLLIAVTITSSLMLNSPKKKGNATPALWFVFLIISCHTLTLNCPINGQNMRKCTLWCPSTGENTIQCHIPHRIQLVPFLLFSPLVLKKRRSPPLHLSVCLCLTCSHFQGCSVTLCHKYKNINIHKYITFIYSLWCCTVAVNKDDDHKVAPTENPPAVTCDL